MNIAADKVTYLFKCLTVITFLAITVSNDKITTIMASYLLASLWVSMNGVGTMLPLSMVGFKLAEVLEPIILCIIIFSMGYLTIAGRRNLTKRRQIILSLFSILVLYGVCLIFNQGLFQKEIPIWNAPIGLFILTSGITVFLLFKKLNMIRLDY